MMDHQTSTTASSGRDSTSQPNSIQRLLPQSPPSLCELAPETRNNIYRYLIPDPGKRVSIILRRNRISGLTTEEKQKLALPVSDLKEVWRCRSSFSPSSSPTTTTTTSSSSTRSCSSCSSEDGDEDEAQNKDGVLAMISLMQTCRLFHGEVAPVVYPCIFFKFPCKTDFLNFANFQPPSVIASITGLATTLNDKDIIPQLPKIVRSMLNRFESLRELRLDNFDRDSMYGSMSRPYMLKACMVVKEMCPLLTKTYFGLYMRDCVVRFSHEASKADCHELEFDVDESYRRWFGAK